MASAWTAVVAHHARPGANTRGMFERMRTHVAALERQSGPGSGRPGTAERRSRLAGLSRSGERLFVME
eukprot:32-Alexandrium_andersonii.AAC.1